MARTLALLFFCMGLIPALTAADEDKGLTRTIARAIENGTVKLNFRYRFEFVDEDGFEDDAYANTLRSRLTFAPQITDDWGVVLEFDDVRQVQSSKFNDTRNNNTDRPSVIDPEGTDLNQALIRYTGIDNLALALGRQRIWRFNQRIIGGVPWRQNEQTYDSVSASFGEEGPFQVFYSYVWQINRIFGPDSGTPPADLDNDTHLLDMRYVFNESLNLSGYGYFLDTSDNDVLSNLTAGVRLDGKGAFNKELNYSYIAEYAYQEDYGDNPVSYDADYYLLEGGLGYRALGFKAGCEVLGGNDQTGAAFRTPLATLHIFQGLADRFAGVSASGLYASDLGGSGIEDLYISASLNALAGTFTLTYHDFEAETGSRSWGEEWDAQARWKFGNHYGLLVQYASFDSDDFPVNDGDLTKFWVQLTAEF
jgi:hypothetical protein